MAATVSGTQNPGIHPSVQEATAAGLPSYSYSAGVITASSNGALTVDGVAVQVADRVLVKNETSGNAPYNGIYVVTATGGSGAPYVLTRAPDMATTAQVPGSLVLIEQGTQAGQLWQVVSAGPFTLSTTNITWTQFTGGGVQIGGDLGGTATVPRVDYLSGLLPSGDSSGATDLGNINGLIAIAGTAYLGLGTFQVNGSLAAVTGTVIDGKGETATVIQQLSTTADTITGTNLKSFVMRNVRLLGPSSGTGNGIHLSQSSANVTTYVDLIDCRILNFGGDGVKIDNPIVSRFSRVVSSGNTGNGFNMNGNVSATVGTSVTFESCYAISNGAAGYQATSIHYMAFIGTACDSNASGYILTNCENVTMVAPGCETTTGNSYTISGGSNITLIDPFTNANNAIAFWVTGSAQNVRLIHPQETAPTGSATASIQVDSGSYCTVERQSVTTAVSYAGTVAAIPGVREVGDTVDRWFVDSSAVMRWGGGSGAVDTFLQRIGAAELQTNAFLQFAVSSSATNVLQSHVSGDTAQRFQATAAGLHQWGPGNASADVELSRTAAGILTVQPVSGAGGLAVTGANSSASVLAVTNTSSGPSAPATQHTAAAAGDATVGIEVTGDTFQRLLVDSNGKHSWGSGSGAADTDLYRSSAGVLATDTALSVGTSLTVDGTVLASPEPGDLSLLAWTYDAAICSGSGVALGTTGTALAGVLELIKIPLRGASISTTGLRLYLTGDGSGLTSAENWAYLYNSAGTFLAATADQTTNWGSGSLDKLDANWASGPFTVSGAFCWVALVYNGSTGPSFLRANNLTAGMANGKLTNATSRYGSILSSVTTNTPGNFTPSSITQKAATIWAALF